MREMRVLRGIRAARRVVTGNEVTIAIDVIRCSSTLISGLHNGAREFIPAASLREVGEIIKRNPEYLTAGERGGAKIKGFDLGNSPTEMTSARVWGKSVVITTSHGTGLMRCGVTRSQRLFIGALVNSSACADAAAQLTGHNNGDVKALIPRTWRNECVEDLYAAGLIARRLVGRGFAPRGDTTRIALLTAEVPWQRVRRELRDSPSAELVARLGYGGDVEYSLRVDAVPLVPFSQGLSVRI